MDIVVTILLLVNIGFLIYILKRNKMRLSPHLKQNKEYLELANFFKVSIDFMCVANQHGEFERVNQALICRLGFTEADLIGKKAIDFIHPEDLAYTRKKIKCLYQGLQVKGFINRFKCHDGSYVALKWNFVPDLDNRRLFAVARDLTEQEKTAKELKLLSRIARETHNGVVITDINEKIEWVNKGFTYITGYEIDDVIGKKPSDIFQGAQTSQKTRMMIAKAIKNQEPFKAEILNYRKNGEPYWLDIDCNPFFNDSGQIEGFMAIETDITHQKNNQLELKKKTALLEQMSTHGRIGAWEVDMIGGHIYWSSMTKKIHEVDDDFQPNLQEAINFYKEGESRDTISAIFENTLKTGDPWFYECQLVTQKGNEIWVTSTGQAEFKEGKCVRVFGSFQDINERKIHQIVNQRALRYSQTLEELTVSDDVTSGNLDKALSLCTKACAKASCASRVSIWFFKSNEDVMECVSLYHAGSNTYSKGMTLSKTDYPIYINAIKNKKIIIANDVYQHPDLKEFLPHYVKDFNITSLLDVVISGDGSFFGVICLEHTNEKHIWSEADESFISAVATLISSVYDRKIRKDTEIKLLDAVDKANNAVQAKSEFLASMSHEIRTPMNGVIGMLRAVLKTPLVEKQKHKVHVAKKSAESLLGIINDILDFSKIDAGKMDFEHIHFDFMDFIRDFYEEIVFLAAENKIDFTIDTQQVNCQYLMGDTVRIKQVLTNLATNAFKFTHKGSVCITLKTQKVGPNKQQLVGTVQDTGIGIEPSKIDLLFNAFTQVDASTTREYGGTGLGLSIVRQLCNSMDGDVWVTSQPQKGSCFTFTLNLQESTQNRHKAIPKLQTTCLQEGAKVLLVEDNRINQEVAEDLLQDLKLDVHIVDNGLLALRALSQANNSTPFDAVLMDCQMPIMDGYTATQKIREGEAGVRCSLIPIIAMTANAMEGDKQRCLDSGMNDYLSKPVDSHRLHVTLCKWLPCVPDNKSVTPDEIKNKQVDKPQSQSQSNVISENKWDAEALFKRVNRKPDRMQRLISLYIEDSEKLLNDIDDFLKAGSMQEAAFCCHSLKGVSANIGGMEASDYASQLNKACKNAMPSTDQEMKEQELNSMYNNLLLSHRALLKELTAYTVSQYNEQ